MEERVWEERGIWEGMEKAENERCEQGAKREEEEGKKDGTGNGRRKDGNQWKIKNGE